MKRNNETSSLTARCVLLFTSLYKSYTILLVIYYVTLADISFTCLQKYCKVFFIRIYCFIDNNTQKNNTHSIDK